MDGVVREKLFEFAVELGGKGFVVRYHQRWLVDFLDHIGHREGLSRAGGSEQHLMLLLIQNVLGKSINGSGLITAWLEWRMEFEHDVGGLSKDLRTH